MSRLANAAPEQTDCRVGSGKSGARPRVVLFANTSWYLANFRMHLLQTLRDSGYDVVLLSPRDEHTELLLRERFEWHDIEMDRRSTNPFAQLGLLWQLFRFWRRMRPDIVHCFTVKCVIAGGLTARLARVPLRISAIAGLGTIFSDRRRRGLRLAVVRALKIAVAGKASRVIVQNPDDAKVLAGYGIVDRQRVHLIRGSGVDGERFVRTIVEPMSGPVKVLMAARLLWAKGVRDFVAAAQACSDLEAEFLIAGAPDPGNPDSVDPQFLDHCQSIGNLALLGHVTGMAALMRNVSIVVLPSRYGEGVPRSLVESAAAGMPLVAYDIAGSREIILHGQNGYLCEPGDTDALVSRIRELIEDAALRKEFGLASRAHFESEYDQQTVNQKTLEVYRTLDGTDSVPARVY